MYNNLHCASSFVPRLCDIRPVVPTDKCQESAKASHSDIQPLADAIRNFMTSTPLQRVRLVGCYFYPERQAQAR